jgi:hypothetical protein
LIRFNKFDFTRKSSQTTSCRPIRHYEPRNAREFAVIERNQRRATAAGLPGDQIVIVTDQCTCFFKFSPDVAGMRGVFGLERPWRDGQRQEGFEASLAACAPLACGSIRQQVRQSRRTVPGVDDAAPREPKADRTPQP